MSRGTLDGDRIRWHPPDYSPASGSLMGKHIGYLCSCAFPVGNSSRIQLLRTRDGAAWETVSDRRFTHMASFGSRPLGLGRDTLLESRDSGRTCTEAAAGFLESQMDQAMLEKEGIVYIGGSTYKGVLALSPGKAEWLNQGMYGAAPGPLLVRDAQILIADPNRGLLTYLAVFGFARFHLLPGGLTRPGKARGRIRPRNRTRTSCQSANFPHPGAHSRPVHPSRAKTRAHSCE